MNLEEYCRSPEFHDGHGHTCRHMGVGEASQRVFAIVHAMEKGEYTEAYSMLNRGGVDVATMAIAMLYGVHMAVCDVTGQEPMASLFERVMQFNELSNTTSMEDLMRKIATRYS